MTFYTCLSVAPLGATERHALVLVLVYIILFCCVYVVFSVLLIRVSGVRVPDGVPVVVEPCNFLWLQGFSFQNRLSSGLKFVKFLTVLRVVKCMYLLTISRDECPSICCKVYISPPFSRNRVANVCRKRCGRIRVIRVSCLNLWNINFIALSVIGRLSTVRNTQSQGA